MRFESLPVALLLIALAGCSSESTGDGGPLWTGETEWVKLEEGWVRAVPLVGSRTFRALSGGRFRTVAIPVGSSAALNVTAPDGTVTRTLTRATPIELDLGRGDELTLASPEGTYLLRPRVVDPKKKGRRILLAVADTLRFDHATEERMPAVYRHFDGGTRFLRAYSPASWTLPSVASLFTGRLPARLRSSDGTLISLGPSAVTLASELSARGYATVGVVGNYTVNHENGYSSGFDLFYVPDAKVAGSSATPWPDAGWLARHAMAAAEWFVGEDLFLYLQFMEPHDPYRNHETGEILPAPVTGQELAPDQLESLRRAYASEVGHLDRVLADLLQGLGEFDLSILTSDHGEELFEHGGFRHGPTLFDEAVHVPLWIRGSEVEPKTIPFPVSLTSLKDWIVDGDEALMRPRPAVTMETFSFGPPRWSGLLGNRRVIYAASLVVADPDESPIEKWLRENHPRFSFSDLEEEGWVEPDPQLVQRSVAHLIHQFDGFRRGLFMLFAGEGSFELTVSGAERDGIFWGAARKVEVVTLDERQLAIKVESPQPFTLLFLPCREGVVPEVRSGRDGDQPRLAEVAPRRWRGEARTVWFDGGPSEEISRETDETLRRLKALGYIPD